MMKDMSKNKIFMTGTPKGMNSNIFFDRYKKYLFHLQRIQTLKIIIKNEQVADRNVLVEAIPKIRHKNHN